MSRLKAIDVREVAIVHRTLRDHAEARRSAVSCPGGAGAHRQAWYTLVAKRKAAVYRHVAGEPHWGIPCSLEGWHVVLVDENFDDVLSGQMLAAHSDAIAAIEAVMCNPVVPARVQTPSG